MNEMFPASAKAAARRGRPFVPLCEGSAMRPESAAALAWAMWPCWRWPAAAQPDEARSTSMAPVLLPPVIVMQVAQVPTGGLMMLL